MADTEYILDGLKQAIIHYVDPSQLSDQPLEGLREKEDILKNLNNDVLRDNMDDFDELETLVKNSMGSKYTSLLLNKLQESDLQKTLPVLQINNPLEDNSSSSSSSSSSLDLYISSGVPNDIDSILIGNDYDVNLFNELEWTIIDSPDGSSVDFSIVDTIIDNNISTIISSIVFSIPGIYTIKLQAEYSMIHLMIQDTIMLEVV